LRYNYFLSSFGGRPLRHLFSQPFLARSGLGADLKGAEDTFLTLLKVVIAQCNSVNVFVTYWSGSGRRLADGWKRQ
jgi:hypothetical protein